MKKRWRIFTICLMLIAGCLVKADASAAVVPNTSGEVSDDGYVYSYKYWNGTKWKWVVDTSYCANSVPITYEVTYNYEEAYKMLDLVNAERRKAGVPELKANDRMMQVAMERAAQTCCYWKHEIPDGSGFSEFSMFIDSENLCGGGETAKEANDGLVESDGHYKNMINSKWKYAGFGCVKTSEGYRWVQIFCNNVDSKGQNNLYEIDGYPDKPIDMDAISYGQFKNSTQKYTAYVNPKFINLLMYFVEPDTNINIGSQGIAYYDKKIAYVGDTLAAKIYSVSPFEISGGPDWTSTIPIENQCTVTSMNPDIVEIENEKVICKKSGKATVNISLKANPSLTVTKEIEVKDKELKKGATVTVSNCDYKVSSVKNKTVSFTGNVDTEKVTIPATVTIQGKKYKVTSIEANAFKNNKKLKSVTVGTNVKSIGKDAFSGCGNLKKITIKSTKLQSVGKNALKGVNKKAVIKVPKSKLSSYKKLFKGKGQKKTVQIKK